MEQKSKISFVTSLMSSPDPLIQELVVKNEDSGFTAQSMPSLFQSLVTGVKSALETSQQIPAKTLKKRVRLHNSWRMYSHSPCSMVRLMWEVKHCEGSARHCQTLWPRETWWAPAIRCGWRVHVVRSLYGHRPWPHHVPLNSLLQPYWKVRLWY